MFALLIELLRSGELPEMAANGAWFALNICVQGRPAVGMFERSAELGMFELAAAQLLDIGRPADWIVRPFLRSCLVFPLWSVIKHPLR